MEAEIAFGEVHISRQASEPTPDKSGPNEQPDGRDGYSDYEQHFAQIIHGSR
jgi:hypothetical protein